MWLSHFIDMHIGQCSHDVDLRNKSLHKTTLLGLLHYYNTIKDYKVGYGAKRMIKCEQSTFVSTLTGGIHC